MRLIELSSRGQQRAHVAAPVIRLVQLLECEGHSCMTCKLQLTCLPCATRMPLAPDDASRAERTVKHNTATRRYFHMMITTTITTATTTTVLLTSSGNATVVEAPGVLLPGAPLFRLLARHTSRSCSDTAAPPTCCTPGNAASPMETESAS